jgi:flagellar biosynthesis/type III secretory pathway protein FliH
MIWSKSMMTPFMQPQSAPLTTPVAWTLQELRAEGSAEIFRTPEGDIGPTDDELAAEAAAERNRLVSDAYEAGFEAGRVTAEAAADAKMSSAIDTLHRAAAQIVEGKAKYLNALEDNLAALATVIARHIIGREVRGPADITADLIRRAVTEFPLDEPLRIRINPLDLSTLAVAPGGDAVRIAPGREITWVPDSRVQQGGCLVEGRERILDGRIDTALERTYRRLANSVA